MTTFENGEQSINPAEQGMDEALRELAKGNPEEFKQIDVNDGGEPISPVDARMIDAKLAAIRSDINGIRKKIELDMDSHGDAPATGSVFGGAEVPYVENDSIAKIELADQKGKDVLRPGSRAELLRGEREEWSGTGQRAAFPPSPTAKKGLFDNVRDKVRNMLGN